MSSATACPRFVQNAWKRDLCSHCFKPKEDHVPVQPPPAPAIFFSSKQPAQSILKNGVSSSRKSNCVHFPAEESQVIGYGGDECYSDPEDDVSPVSFTVAALDDDDDEAWKVLQRLTQANTQFNAVTSNLSAETVDSVEAPTKQRIYTHLQLGRTPTDDRGNKRTLQVSVTPFGGASGEDNNNPPPRINGFRKILVKEEENIESDKTLSKISINKSRSIYRAPAFNGRSDLENRAENDVIIPRIKSLRPSISNNENEVKTDVSNSLENTKETETISPSPEELPKEDGDVIEAPIVECKPKLISDSLEDLSPNEPPVVKSESSIVLTKRIQPPVTESDDNEKNNPICESRELAGEPDGRADDTTIIEPPPPALPSSPPPPLDPRPSFLHGLVSSPAINKPKVPIKPAHVLSSRPPLSITTSASILLSTSPPVTNIITNTIPSETLSSTTTTVSSPPPPPPITTTTTTTATTTTETSSLLCSLPDVAQSAILLSSSCSKSESENIERSCSSRPTSPETARALKRQAPRPPAEEPRRSLSAESLTCTSMASSSASATTVSNVADISGKKKKSHGHFSLRKLLRFGSKESTQNGCSDNKTNSAVSGGTNSTNLSNGAMLLPKPRPEIIHPLDLMNASPVQVVGSATSTNKDYELLSDASSANNYGVSQAIGVGGSSSTSIGAGILPAPPPRGQLGPTASTTPSNILGSWGRELVEAAGLNSPENSRPVRPPPPKASTPTPTPPPIPNPYANLAGEIRSSLAPCKPHRSPSVRDASSASTVSDGDGGYESVELEPGPVSSGSSDSGAENVYESVVSTSGRRSSSPECDKQLPNIERNITPQQNLTISNTIASVEMESSPTKYRPMLPRPASLIYCSSETESDIYAPYSFLGSEDGGDWSPTQRTSRLRFRKGRSVVHRNLEDNYGAVIVANHEALAEVLEQVYQGPSAPVFLRPLRTTSHLRWSDFATTTSDDGRPNGIIIGRRAFIPAVWGQHSVTLAITADLHSATLSVTTKGKYSLAPIVTEFCDLVPSARLPPPGPNSSKTAHFVQASIAVLPRLIVDSLQTYGVVLRERANDPEIFGKEASFVLLQLINALKFLQAQGIEEVPLSLSSFAICRDDRESQPRLCILQDEECVPRGSLCQSAMLALEYIISEDGPSWPTRGLVSRILRDERAVSLSQVKSLLEFSLWGPSDVALGSPLEERELAIQRWLDLERATVLHGLVRTRVELTPFDECHLLFLVRTSANIMCQASKLIEQDSCSS